MKTYHKKVVAITGAGSGIGRELAIQLAELGAIVAIADKNSAALAQTLALLKQSNATCSAFEVDVADYKAVQAYATAVVDTYGCVHAVFNNAGVALVDSVEQQSLDDMHWLMDINYWGVVHGTKAFLPHLQRVDDAHIVNISSVFGLLAVPLQSAYNASKFAVRGFTEALKMEMAGSHIHVSCVHPGGIKTDIVKHSRMNPAAIDQTKEALTQDFANKAKTTADSAARTIINGTLRNKRRILIGLDAKIISVLTRIFPASYEYILRLETAVRRRRSQRTD